MTSPALRKKSLLFKRTKEKLEQSAQQHSPTKFAAEPVVAAELVALPTAPVVQSVSEARLKKVKNALVELNPQDQVVEQPKEEVNTQSKE